MTLAKITSTAKGRKQFTETISVTHAGNIAAKNSLPIMVDTLPDGLMSDATQLTSSPSVIMFS